MQVWPMSLWGLFWRVVGLVDKLMNKNDNNKNKHESEYFITNFENKDEKNHK